ncbi:MULTISPECIES: nucleotide exchange factor GrpE [Rhodomicrobium]|uniref:nucleotide exchange factor GrpE n=1 Tax=Rhodomicrobium TaxID=1068 RepID=UPI000B4A8B6C|nr:MULTISPECIES: nucleotide exchange factor GrpE [Rhodomicrobium]
MKNRLKTEMNGLRTGEEPQSTADGPDDRSIPPEAADAGEASPPDAAPEAEEQPDVGDLEDRLMRALAEQENIRARGRREMERAVQFAGSQLSADLLDTADNLQRAIGSIPESALADTTIRQLFEGLLATERALLAAFARHGIVSIDALGKPYDPALHEAVQIVPDEGQGPGVVSAVLKPGYMHHDRLLRPAAVHVTTGV